MKKGEVYLVGAGSGDPDLITVKVLRLIKKCDVIIYDRLIGHELIDHAKKECEKIYVGKAAGKHSMKQEEINQLIVSKAKEGKMVVRLKGGDPFVFGRGGEEVLELKKSGIPYSVVSGISSSIAVPAAAGIPVTHRGISQSFTVVTGHTADFDGAGEDFEVLAKIKGTLVFLMGLGSLDKIAKGLMENGKDKDTLVAVISEGTTKNQLTIKGRLENICEIVHKSNIKSPAVIVIGGVCGLDFSPTIKGVLDGVKVGLTGTKGFNEKLKDELAYFGADVKEVLRLRVEEKNKDKLKEALANIGNYDWIVFTSTNGVKIFFNSIMDGGKDLRILAKNKFAVIGKGTYDTLSEFGIKADLMPELYTAEELGRLLWEKTEKKEKILILRAEEGSNLLTKELKDRSYEDLKIYKVFGEESINFDCDFDFITFGSSSAVRNFFEEKNLDLGKAIAVAIGSVTAKTLENYGVKEYIVSQCFTAEGIAEKLVSEVNKND